MFPSSTFESKNPALSFYRYFLTRALYWASCSFELPDDVFYDGQSRPIKITKKTKKRVHATMDSGDSVITPTRIDAILVIE
jgi:hypothetical protein